MNYELMHRKLEAARKEMRQNVPMLKLIDDTLERMNRQFEQMIWWGSPNVKTQ